MRVKLRRPFLRNWSDSQLFGHERGALPERWTRREGWFERADGGTLLLDEVAELPLAAQVRLLRICRTAWLRKSAGQSQFTGRADPVAATHRDLAAMVQRGNFERPMVSYCLSHHSPAVARAYRGHSRACPPFRRAVPQPVLCCRGTSHARRQRVVGGVLLAWKHPRIGGSDDRAAILGDGKRLEVQKPWG